MREFSGSIAGIPCNGWFVERPQDLNAFEQWVRRTAEAGTPVAVDSETCGLKIYSYGPGFLRLFQVGTATEAWAIPIEYGRVFAESAAWSLRTLPALVGHNLHGFDLQVFDKHLGVTLEETCGKSTDTMFLAKLIDPRQQMEGGIGSSLKPLSAHYVDPSAPDTQDGLKAVFKELGLKVGEGFEKINLTHPTYLEYGLLDVILTSHLLPALVARLDQLSVPETLRQFEHEQGRIAAHMQRAGMVCDQPYTEGLQSTLAEEAEHFADVAGKYGVESVNSGKQVSEALLAMGETFILPGKNSPERTAGGALKVDKAVLLHMSDLDRDWKPIGARKPNKLAEAVLRAKRAGKWRSAYADNFLTNLDAAGRIHPNIQTMAARTGRMSVTNPAVQTLPSGDWKIRRALMADEGHRIISTDFQAIELRVLAGLADVRRMKEAIAAGRDLHDFTAQLVFGDGFTEDDRKVSKGIAFGKVYGGGATTVARQTGAPMDAVQRAMRKYDQVYPEVGDAARFWQRKAFHNQMVFVSLTGRRLPLDRDRTYAVTNYACQSVARDCLGQALIHMDAAGLLPYLRLPIHDEVLASAPEKEAEEIAREIGKCMTFELLGVPIEAEPEIGGRSWGSLYLKKKVNGKKVPDLDMLRKHDPYYAAAA